MANDPEIVKYYTALDVPDHAERNEKLAALVLQRRNWPRLKLAEGESGGWDVVLRIDGAYSDRKTAEQMLRYYAHCAAGVEYTEDEEDQDA